MWIACTNRGTIEVAARAGLGALAFSFVDPGEAGKWVGTYYDLIRSEECVPLGHTVNPNIALVSSFSMHEDRGQAIRNGLEGFEFFRYAVNALVAHDARPGRSTLWDDFQRQRGDVTEQIVEKAMAQGDRYASTIGTPDDARRHLRALDAAGVDQVIFIQQAGQNRHDDICGSLEMFAKEVMPEFHAGEAERVAKKQRDLQPFVDAALGRKQWMRPLEDDEIPIVRASAAKAQVPDDGAAL
jgi:alkanesulfonate monooxygenase SsuD/methylene tetrahydromethanopterin reductase-like flavin-dependent oxidoreductase (luciferase family)